MGLLDFIAYCILKNVLIYSLIVLPFHCKNDIQCSINIISTSGNILYTYIDNILGGLPTGDCDEPAFALSQFVLSVHLCHPKHAGS